MLKGFYKVEFATNGGKGRSVMYAHDGVMLGGNSAFAHLGIYREADGDVIAEITTQRHNHDPSYKAMLVDDIRTICITGRRHDDATFRFFGGVRDMPGVTFESVITPLGDNEIASQPGAVGDGGIVNGFVFHSSEDAGRHRRRQHRRDAAT